MIRRIFAIIACYAIVTQAVLAGFASATMAHASANGVLCIASGNSGDPGNQQQPGQQHNTDCCLTAGCSSAGVGAVVSSADQPRISRQYQTIRVTPAHEAPRTWPSERPRSSRAPPV
ncbi:MAG: DUF2946 family protein [Xanthobacteraceae bacterium]